jgi:hypothetical protein
VLRHTSGLRAVAVLATCIACGSSGGRDFVAEDFSQSGSRLKLHWLVVGDGRTEKLEATGFATEVQHARTLFFDADLGVECMAQWWHDGAMYCTPGPYALSVYYKPVYRDAGCTQPAIIVEQQPGGECLTPPYYAKIESFGIISMFARLGAPTVDSQYFHLQNYTAGAACEGPMPLRSGAQLYEAAHLFEPSELVQITLGPPRGDTGRLQWQYIESPDGLVAPGVIYDQELGRTCGFGPYGSDVAKVKCTPPATPVNDRVATVTLRPSSDARLSPALVESDETRLFLGGLFYDRTIDLALRPVLTADGIFRAATRLAEPSPMFEDSACTIPIALVSQNTGSDPAIDHVVTRSCSGIDHAYAVGDKAPQPYVYSQPHPPTPPSCIPYVGNAYRIGAEVPFDALGPEVTLQTD